MVILSNRRTLVRISEAEGEALLANMIAQPGSRLIAKKISRPGFKPQRPAPAT
jgi:hypothetical protein